MLLLACGGSSAEPTTAEPTAAETTTVQRNESGDREHAVEVARALSVREGLAEAEYEMESAELVADGAHAGHWLVSFTHVEPAPPGGHFGVYVDPSTWQGELVRGE